MDNALEEELKILMLEDEPTDAELIERELRKAGLKFAAERVITREEFVSALNKRKPDVLLSDYKLPDFDGLSAVKLLRKIDPDLPVIMVSGFIGDQAAVELIRAGANDYVLKDRLARLPSAVQRAVTEAEGRRERKRIEEALGESEAKLRESEAIYHSLVAAMAEGVVVQAADGSIIAANPAAEKILGRSAEQLLEQRSDRADWHCIREDGTPLSPDLQPSMVTLRTGQPQREVVLGLCKPDVSPTWISVNSQPLQAKVEATPHAAVVTFHDITARKQAERALQRLNRTLRTLSAANAAVVRATTEEELLNEMCRVGVEVGGYRLAWIGFVVKDEAKTVQPVAWSGEHPEYIQAAKITWADSSERGHGPTGTAIRTGEAQINQDVATNPAMAPWRSEMLRCGFKASIALPLKNRLEVFGTLTFYAGEEDAFGPDEVDLLKELAADLAFGIYARRDRVGREAALSALQESLKSTVQAIATAVEMRDAYTAGHQRRVAELASAIARKVGMTESQVEGLTLAAMIHDVGKINVPAELLSKPGHLTPLEYQMIQTHVKSGYEIIKGVRFPWPIGQIVLQHHERLDGSGYPNGLKAEAILIEAKILAVADVVEAMLTHRPYRPSLGLDAALAEIVAGKCRLYDPAVVDACTALFRQESFAFH